MRVIVNERKKQKDKTNEPQDQDYLVCRSEHEGLEKEVQSKKTPRSPRREKQPSGAAISHMSVHQRLKFLEGHPEHRGHKHDDGIRHRLKFPKGHLEYKSLKGELDEERRNPRSSKVRPAGDEVLEVHPEVELLRTKLAALEKRLHPQRDAVMDHWDCEEFQPFTLDVQTAPVPSKFKQPCLTSMIVRQILSST